MKVAFPADERINEGTRLDRRFGRALGFMVFDTDNSDFDWLDNEQNIDSPKGAGIQAAQHLINNDVNSIVVQNIGPKAFDLLNKFHISIYAAGKYTIIDQAYKAFLESRLSKLTDPNTIGLG
ncbi:MAG: NifB/NifX family molybdenum-iron cluster-binding protein [Spirochaetia bacterium]